MAQIESQVFDIGNGVRLKTKSVPLPGLIAVIETFRTGGRDGFRYSTDNGVTFSNWRLASFNSYEDFGLFTDLYELVVDFVPKVDPIYPLEGATDNREPSVKQYDNSVYSWFFDQNSVGVMNWAFNVLEKLFETGIIPTYISRQNSEDYSLIFFSITQFFGLLVMYGRQFCAIEESEMMMKNFIEGWNLVFTTIDTLAERQYIFNNWISEFYKRGTTAIAKKGTTNGELLRLVGYDKPNEFLFAILRAQDMGWCIGYSSPTWRGTNLLDQLSKDPTKKQGVFDDYTNYTVGVVQRLADGNRLVLKTKSTGLSGISFERKPLECHSGLSYAIYVQFKVLGTGTQKIDFGVRCYDKDMNEVVSKKITDLSETVSFLTPVNDGGALDYYVGQAPIPNQSYVWKGILYNVDTVNDPSLYLNFTGGIPLRFGRDCRYIAPYFVQNRVEGTPELQIEEFKVRPLELPVSQGYLGQKNFVALYAENNSMMTKKDVLSFMKRYLLNFKNVVAMNWIDPQTVFLDFTVYDYSEGVPIEGAVITLNTGFSGQTDSRGKIQFGVQKNTLVNYTVQAFALTVTGVIDMVSSKEVVINMEIPYSLIIVPGTVEIGPEGGVGTATVKASRPWAFDTPIDGKETGVTLTPMSGDAGETLVTINIPLAVLGSRGVTMVEAESGGATVGVESTGEWPGAETQEENEK